ncbi:MYCBP-associated protein isoform X2 [Trichomycterus rosablanca]|uniref:MYCBP-associated protein isoform X2 n=1 Tax=Trichomycterus rosablanca TaxID=2290929 RepID=UPI002F353195
MSGLCKSAGKVAKIIPRAPEKPAAPGRKQGSEELTEELKMGPVLQREDVQELDIRPEHLEKLRAPQPPKDSQKPRPTTRVLVRKTRPSDEDHPGRRVTVARPLPPDTAPEPLDYTGPGGPRFDSQGMVLPHSILGSMEDFRIEMEARGETELVRRIPDGAEQRPPEVEGRTRSPHSHEQESQGHALLNWSCHMAERRRQQDFIAKLLQKPVEDLLMNQSSRFRETQELRELIGRGLPALHHGHGARVGSEFWSVPQRLGDELSGITATLIRAQRGNWQPVARITQPQSTRLESGNFEGSTSRAWSRSQYLNDLQHELQSVLTDQPFSTPDLDGLEIVGSSRPFTSRSAESLPSLLEGKQEEEMMQPDEEYGKENEDPLAPFDDVVLDVELLPALRIGGQLALWTGGAASYQGEVGVCARLTFEAAVGTQVSADLELKNEGSTAIYYSWQRLALPHSFPEARRPTWSQHFYFNSATAAILPGDTVRIAFTFKSGSPGIARETWLLHTHPVLMGGAPLQVTLRGVALDQDQTTDQRAAIEAELERRMAASVCKSVMCELLRGVQTPERPSSPIQLDTTEEDEFNANNPILHYHSEPVEALKRLWEQAKGSGSEQTPVVPEVPVWDLSMSTLRQVILSLPSEDALAKEEGASLYLEEALSQYNTLIMQLLQPQPNPVPLGVHAIGLQLWRELLDGLAGEALRLRRSMGLPENDSWADTQHEQDGWEQEQKEEKMERNATPPVKDDKKAGTVKEKVEKKAVKPAAKPTGKQAAKEKPTEEQSGSRKKLKDEKKATKLGKEASREASPVPPSPEPERTESPQLKHDAINPQLKQDTVNPQLQLQYTRSLHKQVYMLMETMINSLCDLFDEAQQIQEFNP